MKKLILVAAVAFSSIAFSACTKENVQPQKSSKIAAPLADADKGNLGQGDGGTLPPPHH